MRTLVNGEPGRLPVIALHGGDVIHISFDHLSPEYERFEYRIVHCGKDWQESSDILMSDAVDYTSASIPIEDYNYSHNTTQLFTHYQFSIPSADARPRISGNYRVQISRDGNYDDEMVAEACFMVTEGGTRISLDATDDTEVDRMKEHQQVRMTVDYSMVTPRPANPQEEITTVVLQNQRWDNAKWDVPCDYAMGTSLVWQHARGLIFEAGNEYRRFENTTTRHAAMGMESLRWKDPYYHAVLRRGEPRRNYIYEEDQDGICVIRVVDNTDIDLTADYMLVHFELEMAELPKNQVVYVQGQWTEDTPSDTNTMVYDEARGIYECTMLLKQGYYNYMYLVSNGHEGPGQTAPIEGNYYRTENTYNVLVYYRNPFDRYDRLIGVR